MSCEISTTIKVRTVMDFHKDSAYGLNDWEPVVAFIRGLMEANEHVGCYERAEARVMADNCLLSQSMIIFLGNMKDERGIDIVWKKLQKLHESDLSIRSPWCEGGRYLESICLESLAKIGGSKAKTIIKDYTIDPAKAYLTKDIKQLKISDSPSHKTLIVPSDYPKALIGIRSMQDVFAGGGCITQYTKRQSAEIVKQWRSLKWPGPIEYFCGDGETTLFKTKNKFADRIHNLADPFSDCGIFTSSPKVEYPIGRRRWADSHSYLYFQVPDGSFYNHEYTWDIERQMIQTHFHEHVISEEVRVNNDCISVTVAHAPISTGVEVRGNVFSKRCNSAVRGVWDNPQKMGKNYYVRRANIMTPYRKLFYFCPLHTPIINQYGIWMVEESEKPERFFDSSGNCIDIEGVVENLLIPLDEPKVLAWSMEQYKPKNSHDPFAKRLPKELWPDLTPVPHANMINTAVNARFIHSHCGYAGWQQNKNNGYSFGLDVNSDGVIDEKDAEILRKHAGMVYRMNIGDYGYFGFNWLSPGQPRRALREFNDEKKPYIYVCSYDYGAGYDADSGKVNLFEKVQSGTKLYVEYHYDAPAHEGKDNIMVYLHLPVSQQLPLI